MTSSLSHIWRPRRLLAFLANLTLGALSGQLIQMVMEAHENSKFYATLESLADKSRAHQMVLDNMVKCLRDDNLPEATCITNTILLAEVNGFKNEVARVFSDAGIPRK